MLIFGGTAIVTKVNRMVLHGFKSFAKHTELVFGDKFNVILGPNGSGKSSRGDTEVLLSSGEIKPIGEIVESSLKKSKLHIKLDDGVYTPENPLNITTWGLHPETMKVVEKDISAFIKRDGDPYLFTITTKTGREVTTTGCHPVMVYKDGKIQSELVRNLKDGHLISTPNKLNFPEREIKISLDGIKNKGFLTKEIARFLGYLVGDGCIMPATRRVDFVNSDDELVKDYANLFKHFGVKYKINKRKNTKAVCVYVYSKKVSDSLAEFFKGWYKKEKKHIPSQVMFSKKDILADFLAALFDCDSSVRYDNPTFEYVTMSNKLADNVLLALLRFGIVARKTIKKKYATNTKNKTRKAYYHITIEGKEKLSRLYKSIPLRCINKKRRLKKWAELDIVENPNNDLLPQEVNQITKKCKGILCVPYKPLRKEFPLFAAYIENRCCPTRKGILRVLSIFKSKLKMFRDALSNLALDQESLMQYIKNLNLSRVEASKFIGVTRTTVTDRWDKFLFKAKSANLKKIYEFVKKEITERIKSAEPLIQTLNRLASSDIFWDPITSIRKVKGEPYVYDLTIPNCHNFIGNGIFVHNSNILDAVCFVLGKTSSKSLRAEKSSNLIYNGGKSKKAASHGEVSIYFDNKGKTFPTKDEEVKISRIVKPNGNSVYKINDEVRTRQQIVDLLAFARINPDGYNIILQGDIIQFVEMSSIEKRMLIDEVSGISVYEEKRNKALKELEKVGAKLGEAEIILKERKTYLRELKRDRDQALKFKELDEKIKSNKASYLKIQINKKLAQKNEIDSRITKQRSSLDKLQEQIDQNKKSISEKKEVVDRITHEVEEKGEKEQIAMQKDVEQVRVDIATNKTRISSHENEINRIYQRKEQLQRNLAELNEKMESLNNSKSGLEKNKSSKLSELEELGKKVNAFKIKNKIDVDIERFLRWCWWRWFLEYLIHVLNPHHLSNLYI